MKLVRLFVCIACAFLFLSGSAFAGWYPGKYIKEKKIDLKPLLNLDFFKNPNVKKDLGPLAELLKKRTINPFVTSLPKITKLNLCGFKPPCNSRPKCVPSPNAIILLGTGLAGLVGFRRRKNALY